MILRKETETNFTSHGYLIANVLLIRMNDTPQGDGNRIFLIL